MTRTIESADKYHEGMTLPAADKKLFTPVLFLIYNRPDVTERVFETIRKAMPSKLYVAADGPNPAKPMDVENCNAARAVIKDINWDCEVSRNFREKNSGCRLAVSSAISWFFEQEEEGIILEDDCVPDLSFFYFCQELLSHYRDDKQIMHIGGNNFQQGINRGVGAYYFSRYNHIWGWATWRRAWKHYDVEMKKLQEFKDENKMKLITNNFFERIYWLEKFEKTAKGLTTTWDYQWTFALWNNNGIAITPNVNLVSNIGLSEGATHLVKENLLFIPSAEVFSIIHPEKKEINSEADDFTYKSVFQRHFFSNLLMSIRYFVYQ